MPARIGGRPTDSHLIPAHVWYAVALGQVEPHHLARQYAEPLMPAVLIAHVEEQLQPQTNAEERFARINGLQHRPVQLQPAQLGDGVLESAHARQHHFGGGGHFRRIAGHDGLVADLLEAFLHAPQVAHAVVDDGDFHLA